MKAYWEGSFFIWHSLAHVNRELAVRLLANGGIDGIIPYDTLGNGSQPYPHRDSLRAKTAEPSQGDLIVRHSFPPNFGPATGPIVFMQPWEFLKAPVEWANRFNAKDVAEIWVCSAFIRNSFIQSGVHADKVHVLPHGYDGATFHAGVKPSKVKGSKDEFKFLFVGGTIERKGIDILMSAYVEEFSADEKVRLVVKDSGNKHVYSHSNHGERIQGVAKDQNLPSVTYIDDDLSPNELAGLYAACNCLVQPYRGEGFCLPVIEAMACGLPVITTFGGPTDEIVPADCGWKVASQRIRIPQLAGLESSDDQGWLEPNVTDLRQLMREAFENRTVASWRGANAAECAKRLTWDSLLLMYEERLSALKSGVSHKQTRRRPRISLCMIVKDEERVIADCLKSAAPYFDEVIVVDTGSKDKTIEICRELGAKVVEFPWTNSFAEARNESIRHATGDWIFWMDADDTLPPATGEAILAAASAAHPQMPAFVVPVRFIDDGPAGGVQVDHVKLFKNLRGVQFEGHIHEQVLPSIRALVPNAQVGRVYAHVLHSGYDTTAEGQAKKRERDWVLLARDLAERPDHPFVLFNLGMTHHYTGQHVEAIDWLHKCLAKSERSESHVRKTYAMLAQSLRLLDREGEFFQTVKDGLAIEPDDPELNFYAGQHLTVKNELDAARQHYLRALNANLEGHFSSVDVAILGYKTMFNLANLEVQAGNYEVAKTWFERAIEAAPDHVEIAQILAATALDKKDFPTAKRTINGIKDRFGRCEPWAKLLAEFLLALGDDPVPVLTSELDQEPESWPTRLVLVRTLLNRDEEAAALHHLHQLDSHGIAEAAYFLGVVATRHNDLPQAIVWMERALSLNPQHAGTAENLTKLKASLSCQA